MNGFEIADNFNKTERRLTFIFIILLLFAALCYFVPSCMINPIQASFIPTSDVELEIAKDTVPGHSIVFKFGMNTDLDANVEETVWDGGDDISYLSSAETMEIVSTDADDDGDPLDTGARTVEIFGIDGAYLEINELIILNGLTDVTTSNSYLRIFRMIVRTAGSSEVNEGIITATASVAATVQAQISNGSENNNQTQMAVYTIPANKTGFLLNYYFSMDAMSPGVSADPAANVELFIRPFGEVFQLKRRLGLVREGTSYINYEFEVPFRVDSKSDIKLSATATDNNTIISAGFDIILLENNLWYYLFFPFLFHKKRKDCDIKRAA